MARAAAAAAAAAVAAAVRWPTKSFQWRELVAGPVISCHRWLIGWVLRGRIKTSLPPPFSGYASTPPNPHHFSLSLSLTSALSVNIHRHIHTLASESQLRCAVPSAACTVRGGRGAWVSRRGGGLPHARPLCDLPHACPHTRPLRHLPRACPCRPHASFPAVPCAPGRSRGAIHRRRPLAPSLHTWLIPRRLSPIFVASFSLPQGLQAAMSMGAAWGQTTPAQSNTSQSYSGGGGSYSDPYAGSYPAYGSGY